MNRMKRWLNRMEGWSFKQNGRGGIVAKQDGGGGGGGGGVERQDIKLLIYAFPNFMKN